MSDPRQRFIYASEGFAPRIVDTSRKKGLAVICFMQTKDTERQALDVMGHIMVEALNREHLRRSQIARPPAQGNLTDGGKGDA